MNRLEQLERHAVLLDELHADRSQQSWDTLGDIADDIRAPASAREHLKRSRDLAAAGILGPRAGYGPFRQMYDGSICLVDQTAVTGTAEAALWPTAQYTGFGPNQLRSGQVWVCSAFGVITTAGASQGNLTLTPRFGTSSGGTSLGASAATALAASATNVAWNLTYMFVVRSVGAAGANSNMVGNGEFNTAVAAIAAATGNSICFGSTASVAVDLSIASGLYMGITLGSASDSIKTLGVFLESLN